MMWFLVDSMRSIICFTVSAPCRALGDVKKSFVKLWLPNVFNFENIYLCGASAVESKAAKYFSGRFALKELR